MRKRKEEWGKGHSFSLSSSLKNVFIIGILIVIFFVLAFLFFVGLVVFVQGPRLDPVVPARQCPQIMPQFENYQVGKIFNYFSPPLREKIRKFFTSNVTSLGFWDNAYDALSFPSYSPSTTRYHLRKKHFVKAFDLMKLYDKEIQPFIQNFSIAQDLGVSCSAKFITYLNSTKYVVKIYPQNQHDDDIEAYSFLHSTKRVMNDFSLYSKALPLVSLPFRFGNEELCHAFDVLVGFNRTPPAYFLPVHSSLIFSSVQSIVQKENLRHCQINYTEWKERIIDPKRSNNKGAFVMGTAIQYVPEVKEIFFGKILNFAHSINPIYRGREMGTRLLFDFIVGNIDRLNVNHFSKESKFGDQILLYMDQNSLIYDRQHGYEHLEYLSELMLTICKFYSSPVENLRKKIDGKVLHTELVNKTLDLNSHIIPFFEAYGVDFEKFLKHLPFVNSVHRRAAKALAIVDECVAEKGSNFVFCDE